MRSSLVLLCSLFLTGCALGPIAAPSPEHGQVLQGNVHGGRQPIVGAHVYLFAANTTGYGQPSVSLLNPSGTGAATDSVGTYVTTDANGTFTISNDYSCTPDTQVYLYAVGGDPGAGTNSAAGLIAALGSCPNGGSFLSSNPFVQINEVTTVAAAYSIAGFSTDATHVSSSGTPAAQIGIANAFATAGNLANLSTGTAYATTPAGNGVVPQDVINTIADILASCVNSSGPGSTTCTTLFSNSQSSTTATPSDTATAAINIAHHPVANVVTLFGLITPAAPFLPNRSTPPNDFTLGLYFSAGIQSNPNAAVAIDSQGDIWSTSYSSISVAPYSEGHVIKLSPLGVSLAGSTGFTGGGLTIPQGLTIDPQDNIWIINYSTDSLVKLDSSGNFLSGASGFAGGGIHFPRSLASDGSGNIFVANYGGSGNESASSLSKFNNIGTAVSPATGYTAGGLLGPEGIAVDPFANVWATSYYQFGTPRGTVAKLSNTGSALSGLSGFSGNGLTIPFPIAFDSTGNAWVGDQLGAIVKLSNSGSPLSGSSGFTGGGFYASTGIAIDGLGNAWVANNHDIGELDNSGNVLSGPFGFTSSGTDGNKAIAIDLSGNVWAVSGQTVNELIGAAAPVVTPIARGLANNTLATRP